MPHNTLSYWALETLRERSVAKPFANIGVPDLSDSDLLLSGGADYNDMCVGCHLKPDQTESDMTIGLYPSPPNLALAPEEHGHSHSHGRHDDDQQLRRQYWIIKHGIKVSGMTALVATHSDERMWAMIAFLQKLPELSPLQYQKLTARDDAQSHH
jgi:mono/diheme cytochrome c family protein